MTVEKLGGVVAGGEAPRSRRAVSRKSVREDRGLERDDRTTGPQRFGDLL